MARSVCVELILDTIRGVKGAKDLSKATDDVAKGFGETAREGEKAARAVDNAGGQMSDAARAASHLDREIDRLTGSLREMAIAQALTGKDTFSKQIREQETQVRRLTRNRKLFGDIGREGGTEAATGFLANFASKTAQLGPLSLPAPIAAALAGVGVAVAPLLGAAVSGAIIGGAGIGGVIGGLVLVSKDARVDYAGKALGARLLGSLQRDASVFIRPVLAAVGQIGDAFDQLRPHLRSVFANAANFVAPLTNGLIGFLDPVVRGFDQLVAKAAPVIEAIRVGFADVGQAIGSVFRSLSDNGVEAGMAIEIIFKGVANAIRSVGDIINALTEAFGWLIKVADKLGLLSDDGKAKLEALRGSTRGAGSDAQTSGGLFGDFQAAIEGTGGAADTSVMSLDNLAAASKTLADQNISTAEAAVRLREASVSARQAADKHRHVSIAEESALLALATAMNTATTAADDQGRSVAAATAAHEAHRKKLIEVAIKMGYARDRAVELANKYLAIPKGVNTNVTTPGLSPADKAIKAYDKKINAVAHQIITHVNVIGVSGAEAQLKRLLIRQEALRKGITVSAATQQYNKAQRLAMSYDRGGWTGPGPRMQVAGAVHADEFVVNKPSRRNLESVKPGGLDYMNATGRWPGYADGGRVIDAPFWVTAAMTKIPSLAEALAVIGPTGGSSTYKWIESVVRAAFPGMRVLSDFRRGARTLSGNVSYHALGRAVDFPPSLPLAEWFNYKYFSRIKELITPWNSLNIWNGRRHTYTGAVYRQHNFAGGNAHDHVAFAGGGVIPEPVFGWGASGRTYSFAERGPERVGPLGGGVNLTVNVNVAPTNASPQQIAVAVSRELGRQADIYARAG